jgi:hypothetical protein
MAPSLRRRHRANRFIPCASPPDHSRPAWCFCLHYFLGIQVRQTKEGFFLHQQQYAEDIPDHAGMLSCKPTSTPVDTKAKAFATTGLPLKDQTFYRSIVGALQYLTLTRPELAYVVQQACLHMHDPREVH